MDMREDIFYQFFQELIESYRHDILQREDVKELAQKEIGLWNQIRERFGGLGSEEYKLISELTGCILDISCIKQEQLYFPTIIGTHPLWNVTIM